MPKSNLANVITGPGDPWLRAIRGFAALEPAISGGGRGGPCLAFERPALRASVGPTRNFTVETPMIRRSLLFVAGLITLGLALLPAALAAPTPEKIDGVTVVDAAKVQQLQSSGVPVFDTRVASEYADKTIKGAVSIPYKEKSTKAVDFDRTLDSFDLTKLPPDKGGAIVLFCNSGECWKSYKAAIVARDAGYKKIYWFRGGFPEWSSKGLPTQ
jgi:rhodanese-related sulfurtransferase